VAGLGVNVRLARLNGMTASTAVGAVPKAGSGTSSKVRWNSSLTVTDRPIRLQERGGIAVEHRVDVPPGVVVREWCYPAATVHRGASRRAS
jgi:hypothetical protein